jgi:hypothetical protein
MDRRYLLFITCLCFITFLYWFLLVIFILISQPKNSCFTFSCYADFICITFVCIVCLVICSYCIICAIVIFVVCLAVFIHFNFKAVFIRFKRVYYCIGTMTLKKFKNVCPLFMHLLAVFITGYFMPIFLLSCIFFVCYLLSLLCCFTSGRFFTIAPQVQ